jgi:predicted phage terminase large subunit-like protein
MHGSIQQLQQLHDREWTVEDITLREEMGCVEAYLSFWAYRKYLNPRMIVGWWQREVALELHRFWLDYKAGKRPKLLLQSPPQMGKSTTVTDFLSWMAGHDRNIKIIFSSYSDRLGIRTNLRLQRIFRNPKYAAVFGSTVFGGDMQQNTSIIEFAGGNGEGRFYNTTIGGQITGEGLDVGVIDDPIKGRAEASSELVRDKAWNWLTDDFMARFSDKAGMLLVMTRWHLDDPAGRLIERYPGVRVLRYPALAEEDETHEDISYLVDGALKLRRKGEPLFPEHKSLEFLEAQRKIMTLAGWQSEYQQSPIVAGGDMFPIAKIKIIPERPAEADVMSAARYFDKAGTEGGGAYTCGVLMLRMSDGTFVVADVRRGRWSALDRERVIKQTAQADYELYPSTKTWVEQEPGSGGKESAEATVRMLAGYSVEADRVTGSKEVRADPFAAQWQAGNVRLVEADWNREYLWEHETFPASRYKDQVDASTGAFNKIASKYRYDSSLSWVS